MLFKKNTRRYQSGQAIAIIALLSVFLLGIVGLAIGGGALHAKDTDAKTAARAGSMRAAYFHCTYQNDAQALAEAITIVGQNGFTESNKDDNEVHIVVSKSTEGVYRTESHSGSQFYGTNVYYEVAITAEIPKYLAGFVYFGRLLTTVKKVSGCWGEEYFGENDVVLFATSQNCQNAVNIGTSDFTVNGGIYSAQDLKVSGAEAYINGSGEYLVKLETDAVFTPSVNNPTQLSQPRPEPKLYFIEDFSVVKDQYGNDQYGKFALLANALGDYHPYSNNLTINTNGPEAGIVLNGIYRAPKITILGDNYSIGPDGVSFVTDGLFNAAAPSIVLRPYIFTFDDNGDGVVDYEVPAPLIFSNAPTNCGVNAVDLSASDTTLEGIIYAPNGGVSISAARTVASLVVVAKTIDLHGSEFTLNQYQKISGLIEPVHIWNAE